MPYNQKAEPLNLKGDPANRNIITSRGSPAISLRPVALRDSLTTALPFSWAFLIMIHHISVDV
jgi:hypothetical protein